MTTTTPTQEKKKGPLTFPWWCIFIAYTLSYAFIAISILFIIARGIEFGDLKTQKWLTSILTGFFSSILFTQPIKVFEFLSISSRDGVCTRYCLIC